MIKIKNGILYISLFASVLFSNVIDLQNGINNYSGTSDLSLYKNEKESISYMDAYGTKKATSDAKYLVCGVFGC